MSLLSKVFGTTFVIGILLAATPTWAAGPAAGDVCNELGASKMAANGAAILACLLKTPATGPVSDCTTGGGCQWQYMSGTVQKSGMAYMVPWATIAKYHDMCTDANLKSAALGGFGYMICASACSRFCRDGCAYGGMNCAGTFHNYTDKPDRIVYTGGVMSEWALGTAGCFCYY